MPHRVSIHRINVFWKTTFTPSPTPNMSKSTKRWILTGAFLKLIYLTRHNGLCARTRCRRLLHSGKHWGFVLRVLVSPMRDTEHCSPITLQGSGWIFYKKKKDEIHAAEPHKSPFVCHAYFFSSRQQFGPFLSFLSIHTFYFTCVI